MNSKGFTLVELIAIIVVLAAIFLVSFPALINTIKSDENKKYDNMVKDLCLAGESYIYANIEDFPELSTPNSKIYLSIAKLIRYGSVNKDIRNPETEEVVNNDFVIFNVLSDNSVECEYRDVEKCLITNDRDGSKGLSEWDEVTCGTESFYLILNDENAHPTATGHNVTLLAKYNLNVGADLVDGDLGIQNKNSKGLKFDDSLNIMIDNCNFNQEQLNNYFPSGLQKDELRKKHIEFYKLGYGCDSTLPFSEVQYWNDATTFVYNNQSLLYPYVENYKEYMENSGVDVKEASLASYDQLKVYMGDYFVESNDYESMLANSAYWLGTVGACPEGVESYHEECIYHVDKKNIYTDMEYYKGRFYGVRPIIIISRNEIEF